MRVISASPYFLPARRYASAGISYDPVSVCLCLSHVSALWKINHLTFPRSQRCVCVLCVWFYRSKKFERDLQTTRWKIRFEEVTFTAQSTSHTSKVRTLTSYRSNSSDRPHRRRLRSCVIGHTFILIPHRTSFYFSVVNGSAYVSSLRQKCLFPWWIRAPIQYVVSWAHVSLPIQTAFRSICPFSQGSRSSATQTVRPR